MAAQSVRQCTIEAIEAIEELALTLSPLHSGYELKVIKSKLEATILEQRQLGRVPTMITAVWPYKFNQPLFTGGFRHVVQLQGCNVRQRVRHEAGRVWGAATAQQRLVVFEVLAFPQLV